MELVGSAGVQVRQWWPQFGCSSETGKTDTFREAGSLELGSDGLGSGTRGRNRDDSPSSGSGDLEVPCIEMRNNGKGAGTETGETLWVQ